MLSGFNTATLTAYSIKGYIMATKVTLWRPKRKQKPAA